MVQVHDKHTAAGIVVYTTNVDYFIEYEECDITSIFHGESVGFQISVIWKKETMLMKDSSYI